MGAYSHRGSVVVFGGSGGIGSAIARAVSADGGFTFLVGRTEEPLRELASELRGGYGVADVTEEERVKDVLAQAADAHGPISGLAVCIGSILLKPAHLTSRTDFEATLLLNVTVPFLAIKHAVPHLREQGGSILLFSSAAANIGLSNHEAISAAKGGVIGLTRAAAATYAASNIRVNCIAPGLVRTPLSKRILANAAAEQASRAMHPLGRVGEPADIAPLAAWLLSDQGAWTSGQVFTLDGGLSGLKVQRPDRDSP